jgi:hypothetical protein
MRRVVSVLGCVVLAAALVACSSGRDKSRSSRKGVQQPEAYCPADPRAFADAEKVRDFDAGRGCGVRNAWKIHAIHGVKLSQPAIINCAMANVMSRWVSDIMQPAAADRFGERVVEITVPSAYACRPRNNMRGARLSEHGLGNALDVSGFRFADGEYLSVEQGWFASRRAKKFIAEVRAGACGPFKTVLGPGAPHHDDHLHFDLQRHRSGGSYCR